MTFLPLYEYFSFDLLWFSLLSSRSDTHSGREMMDECVRGLRGSSTTERWTDERVGGGWKNKTKMNRETG